MPKLEMDPPYRHVRGRIGGLVYMRGQNGTTNVARARPDDAPVSEAQQAVREQFAAAAAYAKRSLADPVLAPRYAAAAAAVGQRPFPFALADFLKKPEVEAIDTPNYHGAIGDVITVRAIDGFEVTGVVVAIRDAAHAVLEQGAAVLVDGLWRYTATRAIPIGTIGAIEAVATDRPGHTGSRQVALVVA